MNPITIAVISDLHLGRKARSKDLCPYSDTVAIESDYRKKFKEFATKVPADYLIIPGDLSDTGQFDELKLASEVLPDFAASLGVPLDRILFVPGNHDVDWAVLGLPGSQTLRKSQRYDALLHEDLIFGSIVANSSANMCTPPHFRTWNFGDVFVIGYNSAWHDEPNEKVHHGLVAQNHLEELQRLLSDPPYETGALKIFVVHHHPLQYSDPVPDEPDFSTMTNAGNLLKLLREQHFDLLIHGHKHKPNFTMLTVDSGFPLVILGAGSFSAQLDTRWSGYVNNQFHLIKIEGRDDTSECIYGAAESWTYLYGRGWIPSERNNGIRHRNPFGTYLQPAELKKTVRAAIQQVLATKDFVQLSDLLETIPYLKYLSPDRIQEVLDGLGPELRFKRHGDPPDPVVLLKV